MENKAAFRKALSSALEALRGSGFVLEGPGAIEENFLKSNVVREELWQKLLDPSLDQEVDFGRLEKEFARVWAGQADFTDDLIRKQREGLEFLVDVLYDEILWHWPEFGARLTQRVLRQLDTYVSPAKKRYVIRQYLAAAAESVRHWQSELMRARPYVEPVVQKLLQRPRHEAQFRRTPPGEKGLLGQPAESASNAAFVDVDFDTYLVSGPDLRVAVVADSGYGKTTLLQELFVRAAGRWRKGCRVPFFFRPEDASGCGEEDIRSKVYERLSSALSSGRGQHVRESQLHAIASGLKDAGHLLLLFDALDQASDLQPLVGCITGQSLRSSRVIVTSRPRSWFMHRTAFSAFSFVRLVEFDRNRIEEYLGSLLDQPELGELEQDLLGVPVLASLLRDLLEHNPTQTHSITNRADLYRAFLDLLPRRQEDAAILAQAQREPEDVMSHLRKLAYVTLCGNHLGQFPREVASEAVGPAVLSLLLKLQFVVRFLETGQTLAFRHRSLQEYLAAEALKHVYLVSGDASDIEEYLLHPNWQESVRFLAGMLDDTLALDGLIRRIICDEGDQPYRAYNYHLHLACRCLREAKVAAPCAEKELLRQISTLAKSDRSAATELLGEWRRGVALDRLLRLAESPDSDTRMGATDQLGSVCTAASRSMLRSRINDEHKDVALVAAAHLVDEAPDIALDILLEAAEKKMDYSPLFFLATSALARSRSPQVVSAVAEAIRAGRLLGDFDWDRLSEIEPDVAAPLIIDALTAEPKLGIRTLEPKEDLSLGVLSRVRDPAILDRLVVCLEDGGVRLGAKVLIARALVGTGLPRAIDCIFQIAVRESAEDEIYDREFATPALLEALPPRAYQTLLDMLGAQDDRVRKRAVRILGRLGNPDSVGPLSRLVHDRSAEIQKSALYALYQIGTSEVVRTITAVLENPEYQSRHYAADLLGAIGSPLAVAPLCLALGDGLPNAAYALARIASPDARAALVAAAASSKETVRQSVIVALCDDPPPAALGSFLRAFESQDKRTRTHAAVCLGKLGQPCALGLLIELALDNSSFSFDRPPKLRVVQALGALRLPTAAQVLEDIAVSPSSSSEVKQAALAGLRRVHPEALPDVLVRVLKAGPTASMLGFEREHAESLMRASAQNLVEVDPQRAAKFFRSHLESSISMPWPGSLAVDLTSLAIQYLPRVCGDDAVPVLLSITIKNRGGRAWNAREALETIPTEGAIRMLLEAWSGESSWFARRDLLELVQKADLALRARAVLTPPRETVPI